ncbi:hypothetical protein AAC978_03920 [Desulfitobacterium sp. THU1]
MSHNVLKRPNYMHHPLVAGLLCCTMDAARKTFCRIMNYQSA